MPFEPNEKIDVLYKKNTFVTSTTPDKPWYLENVVPFNDYYFSTDIFTQDIPSKFTQGNYIAPPTDISVVSIYDNLQGTVRKYDKLTLMEVPDSNKKSYYCLDGSGNNLLKDAIPFNYKQPTDGGNLPYKYIL